MTKQDVINATTNTNDLSLITQYCEHRGISQDRAMEFLQVVWATGNIPFMQSLMNFALKVLQNEFSIVILYSKEGRILQVS